MPLQTDVSADRFGDRKPGILKEWVHPIVIGVIAGVVVSFAQYSGMKRIERNLQAEKDRRLLGLQGVWVLETHNKSAAYSKYQELQVQYMAVIAVDASFNVHGKAYKIRERDSDSVEKEYKREERPKSTLHGTLVQDHLTLLFDTQNAQGLPSFQSIDAVFRLGPDGSRITGSFSDEVGLQSGEVCGRKLLDAKAGGPNWFPCD